MNSNTENLESKRGYLKGDFELFHLKDRKAQSFEYHYHDFHKVIIFISGSVTYLIEGTAYRLKPWDILLVSNKEVHKPIIDSSMAYERIAIWVNPSYLEKHSSDDCSISTCFDLTYGSKHNLLRFDPEELKVIRIILSQLEKASKDKGFGNHMLRNSVFMQLMVHLNRKFLGIEKDKEINDIEYDENISMILDYINRNLSEDLSIESISSRFYMSKYYLMHKFKMQTGYSLHNYVLQKRLIAANLLIKKGLPAVDVCEECGFGDYSNFVRAFKKMFGLPPKQLYKKSLQLERQNNSNGHS